MDQLALGQVDPVRAGVDCQEPSVIWHVRQVWHVKHPACTYEENSCALAKLKQGNVKDERAPEWSGCSTSGLCFQLLRATWAHSGLEEDTFKEKTIRRSGGSTVRFSACSGNSGCGVVPCTASLRTVKDRETATMYPTIIASEA